MASLHKIYEIRCPIYGFISLNDWERDIISLPQFQRLRRIRQLGWTDYVYPGAIHSRFEHSLGVMHMATLIYEGIVERSRNLLESELGYNNEGLERTKALVRITSLLHDVGHAPFSHAGEGLFPSPEGEDPKRKFKHEDYSAAIVRRYFAHTIENHPLNKANYGISADDVAFLLEGSAKAKTHLFWRDLIAGQMDADRMDYLLRDSLHAGVDYGRYDWRRIINTVTAVPGPEDGAPRIGVNEGGWHAAEGLILARYFMFAQVYFHKTRVAYDHHLNHVLRELLPGNLFPPPQPDSLDEYLPWDDWRVLGLIAGGNGGEHGRRITERNHFREIYHTKETPAEEDLEILDQCRTALGDLLVAEESSEKSWYKVDETDIPVLDERRRQALPLSEFSSFVAKIEPIRQVFLYVRPEDAQQARGRIRDIIGGE